MSLPASIDLLSIKGMDHGGPPVLNHQINEAIVLVGRKPGKAKAFAIRTFLMLNRTRILFDPSFSST